MKICKFCDTHNNMVQLDTEIYYHKLKQGKTVTHCEFCGDTYEYEKDANDNVNERLIFSVEV